MWPVLGRPPSEPRACSRTWGTIGSALLRCVYSARRVAEREAGSWFEAALPVAKSAGNARDEIWSHLMIGQLLMGRDHVRARTHLVQALELARRTEIALFNALEAVAFEAGERDRQSGAISWLEALGTGRQCRLPHLR